MIAYAIDTSALIDAWVRHYPPDVFPAVWEKLEKLLDSDRLVAPDEVLHELEKKQDDLLKWAKSRRKMFSPPDQPIQVEAKKIINKYPSLTDAQAMRGVADPWVISLASVRGLTVVTAEGSKPRKPRIPDVCGALGIPCINVLELLRREGWKFK